MNRSKLNYFRSLARGLTVLQAFTAGHPSLRLSEIARITGMNPAAQRCADNPAAERFPQPWGTRGTLSAETTWSC